MFRILQIHRWLSLVLGLPVALVALSGLPLALWAETDAIAAPAFYPTKGAHDNAAINRAILAVTTPHPDMSLDFIYFPRASAVMHVGATMPSGEHIEVAVDGMGEQILGTRSHQGSVIGQIHVFHSRFFAGDVGRWLMFALSWALLVSTGSGVWLWLAQPTRKLKTAPRKPQAKVGARILHNLVGIWSSGLLLTMALTTIVLTWPGRLETAMHNHAHLPSAAPPAGKIARIVKAHDGTAKLRSISLGGQPDEPVRAIVENQAGMMRIIMIDTKADAVISDRLDILTSTNAFARGLHGGSAIGHAGRWLMAGASLMPMMMWLTGVWMFTRARRQIKQ
ncbi:PepSY-associated TM helix domain-containing protein [Erythrobacter sp. T5W1-R]|uniref:PepSY-associated TM helix domain-containing protein n=1 Tax=Erythrobacter sp. T5W1-R TaxID=3101752 RepID=UPI002AFFAE85|nr:PepSY-associated TM helix domain-containing protein [Erythrobacter sp. T5W1-R]MEA1619401.1 PepSY-associated TM helix domain-containing protein [Erythrobacter sp. T5W1-R]